MRYIKSYPNVGAVETALDNSTLGRPYVAYVEDGQYILWDEPEKDYNNMCLTFNVISGGTIYMSKKVNDLEYQVNNGSWTSVSDSAITFNTSAGDRISFRGLNTAYTSNYSDNVSPTVSSSTECRFEAEGNMMSIIDKDNYMTLDGVNRGVFCHFFRRCSGLTSVENLVLPATTLRGGCYFGLFRECINLEKSVKELPALSVPEYGYKSLYEACPKLVTVPIIRATAWTGTVCAQGMFNVCGSLSATPVLNLVSVTGHQAFSLTFGSCTSLTQVNITFPETIPNSNLFFNGMFQGCTSLANITCLTSNPYESAFAGWVKNVSPTGTFVKNPNATWPTGTSGIPEGWTITNAE